MSGCLLSSVCGMAMKVGSISEYSLLHFIKYNVKCLMFMWLECSELHDHLKGQVKSSEHVLVISSHLGTYT